MCERKSCNAYSDEAIDVKRGSEVIRHVPRRLSKATLVVSHACKYRCMHTTNIGTHLCC